MRGLAILIAVLLIGTSCSGDGSTPTSTTTSTTEAPTTTQPPATGPTTPQADLPPCLAGDTEFGAEGVVSTFGTGDADASQISEIRWQDHEGCERMVIDFLTSDGAPASAIGPGTLIANPGTRTVRLAVSADRTGVADTLIEGELVDRAYVVRAGDGTLHVEVIVSGAVEARAFDLGTPGRAVLDIRPADFSVGPPPAVAGNVVALIPTPAEYPLEVRGWARTFEANVVVRLLSGDEVVGETATTATDSVETWGSFATTISDGPTGEVLLFVGEDSASTGDPIGILMPLVIN